MHHDDIRLTSGAVLLAGLLLALTDSRAEHVLETPDFRLEHGRNSSQVVVHLNTLQRNENN